MKKEEELFEDKINKAKGLLDKLTNPDITLSDSVKYYKDGIAELTQAQKLLDEAKAIFTIENKEER